MSSSQFIIDAATRHQVFLQRYAGGQSLQAQKGLERLRQSITARLAQEPTDFQRNRLVAVLNDIEKLAFDAFGTITNQTIKGAQSLAISEADFSVKLFDKGMDVKVGFALPDQAVLMSAVLNAPMAIEAGATISIEAALANFSANKTRQILRTVREGIALGETTPAISKALSGMINTLQRRQIDTLVRTITNNASSVARQQVYMQNSELLDGYRWVSTLDGRTTMICGSRDGMLFNNPGIDPIPPAHWGCRSTTIPAVKPEYDLGSSVKGKRPSIGGTGTKQVSGRTTYSGWLKKQPVSFVDEALGSERSKLFRSGKLKLDRFTDPTGKIYNLKQLEDLNPLAFA